MRNGSTKRNQIFGKSFRYRPRTSQPTQDMHRDAFELATRLSITAKGLQDLKEVAVVINAFKEKANARNNSTPCFPHQTSTRDHPPIFIPP